MDSYGAIEKIEKLEASVIGQMLVYPKSISTIMSIVTEDDFTLQEFKSIYILAKKCDAKRIPFDPVTAVSELEKTIGQERAHNIVFSCMKLTTTSANLEYHVKALHGRGEERRLRNEIVSALMAAYNTGEELAGVIMSKCRSYTQGLGRRTKIIGEAYADYYRGIGKESAVKVHTGFSKLDNKLGVVNGGDLMVIGARPSVGKSAFALTLAERAARNTGPVIIYSMEMMSDQICRRMAARYGPDMNYLKTMENDKDFLEKIVDAANNFVDLPLYINDSPKISLEKIRGEASSIEGLKMIIVDYILLMEPTSKHETRNLEVGAICRGLKNLAMELNVVVIALTQLNRKKTETQKPTMEDLRDSGEIEEAANEILLLWKTNVEKNNIGVSIEKNRDGVRGKAIEMHFDGAHMTFGELCEYEIDSGIRKSGRRRDEGYSLPWDDV